MSDATGKLAYRFHLLRLTQLFLRLLASGYRLHQLGRTLVYPLFECGSQFRERRALGRQLRHQILEFEFSRLPRGDVRANTDQRLDAAIRPPHRAGAHVDPVLRPVRPDVAVLDAVVPAGLDRLIQHPNAPLPVVRMNRRQQILIREWLPALPPEITDAGIGRVKSVFRQVQFQRAKVAGVQGGLHKTLALGEIGENGAGLILATPAPDRGTDDAHQRGWVKRPFDEGYVAQHL